MEQQVNDVPIVEAFAVATGAANLSLPLEVTPAPTITVRYFFKTPTETESTTPEVRFSTLMRKAEYNHHCDTRLFLLSFLKHLRYKELLSLYMIEFQLQNVDKKTLTKFYKVADNYVHFYAPDHEDFPPEVYDRPNKNAEEFWWNAVRFMYINNYMDILPAERRELPVRYGGF
jgi:hypothetical protein